MQIVAFVGPITGVVGLFATFYYFRYNKRRKRVTVDVKSAKLVAEKIETIPNKISVQYDGMDVDNPYIVDIQLSNSGNSDVSSKDFDGDKPFEIELKSKIVAKLKIEAATVESDVDATRVLIPPTLLVKGESYHISLLVDGKPDPSHEQRRLIETDVLNGEELDKRLQKRYSLAMKAAVFGLLVSIAIGIMFAALMAMDTRNVANSVSVAQNEFQSAVMSDSTASDYRGKVLEAEHGISEARKSPLKRTGWAVVIIVVYFSATVVTFGFLTWRVFVRRAMAARGILRPERLSGKG
ncbi:hypothetical protein [Nocardia tengchongensis]|uniref:hypothetical protein n=1 Tax=Nocardia tengchongensis TaxID=2055889 RepID=UPI0036536373